MKYEKTQKLLEPLGKVAVAMVALGTIGVAVRNGWYLNAVANIFIVKTLVCLPLAALFTLACSWREMRRTRKRLERLERELGEA